MSTSWNDGIRTTGVDAMRRDLVAHAALGTPGRWKVYIVDEVHMLSNAAATPSSDIGGPPSHVVFVLATTDPQKVPPPYGAGPSTLSSASSR